MSEKNFEPPAAPPPASKRVEVFTGELDEEKLKQLSEVESAAFPEDMRVEPEDIARVFADQRGVNLVMHDSNNEIVGYISTSPHNEMYEFALPYDPDFVKDDSALYIESIGSKPDNRDVYLSVAAFDKLIEQARNKGYKKITMHARVGNGFSKGVQKLYGAKFIRRVENWGDFGEPFDYLEIEVPAEGKDSQ